METVVVAIRCDNPEKNKIGVTKFIKRKLHPYGNDGWVKYNHEKWVVRTYGDNIYHLAYIMHERR